jgi:hypothetical protein
VGQSETQWVAEMNRRVVFQANGRVSGAAAQRAVVNPLGSGGCSGKSGRVVIRSSYCGEGGSEVIKQDNKQGWGGDGYDEMSRGQANVAICNLQSFHILVLHYLE